MILLSAPSDGYSLRFCSFAGTETTSSLLGLTLYALARSLSTQERLRTELSNFHSSSGGDPTYEDIHSRFPILDAVCKEA